MSVSLVSRITTVLLSLLLLPVLGGCGDEQAEDGRTTIRLVHYWGDAEPVWEQAIAEYEKVHPDIHIEQQVLSFNVHVQKVQTGAAGGADIGDLVLMEEWFANELFDRDIMIDLEPYVKRDLKPDQFFDNVVEHYRHDGRLHAFPIAVGACPLYYNEAIFDAAGIPYPDSTWTYDSLLAVAQKLTKDTDGDGKTDQWGFLLDNNGGFDAVLYSMGGAVLSDDRQQSAFNEPRTVRALQFWVDLALKHKVAPPNASVLGGSSSGGSLRPFETGRFAMGIMGPFLTTYRNASFPWNITYPPKGPAGRLTWRFGGGFGVPKSSEHPDEAWEFLRWIVEEMPPKYSDRMFFGLVPNSRRLASSPEYLEGEPNVNRQVLVDLVENYSFEYWRSRWFKFRDQGFLPELDLIMAGEKSVEQGAADADERINEVLSR